MTKYIKRSIIRLKTAILFLITLFFQIEIKNSDSQENNINKELCVIEKLFYASVKQEHIELTKQEKIIKEKILKKYLNNKEEKNLLKRIY